MTSSRVTSTAARKSARPARAPRPRYAVRIADQQSALKLSAAALRRIVRATLEHEGIAVATISVALVDNAAIHVLNRRHLRHDYETDVLSFLFERNEFPADSPRRPVISLDGEVILSTEMARAMAPAAGWRAEDEAALYLVHGLLHLCGYDDHSPKDRRTMKNRERSILAALGITMSEGNARRSKATASGRSRRKGTRR